MDLKYVKSISDPVYGTIPLTELELKIIDTRVFQRLRHVEQLGMANYVFPSADYSRFAHRIGACHTMGQILEHLESQKTEKSRFKGPEIQFRRIAMLLHDVGHYFMSHAAEDALKAHNDGLLGKDLPSDVTELNAPKLMDFCGHEEVGKMILKEDPELAPIIQGLHEDGKAADRLGALFEGASNEDYWTLVSSELDADRLDYLMRSSQATGLPYGHFDRDYIIRNLTTDSTGRVCLNSKAVRAADHFVMCRSFDYLQVVFNKTVVGFEEMLKRCIRHLLEKSKIKLEKEDLLAAIRSQDWAGYTDAYLMNLIREIEDDADARIIAMRDRLLFRKPAPLLWAQEELVGSRKPEIDLKWFRNIGYLFEKGGPGWTENCIFWIKYFRTTDPSPFQTTYAKDSKNEEQKEKSIHILNVNNESEPLTSRADSFTRHLSSQAYVMVRVYYVGPDAEIESTKNQFKAAMRSRKFTEGFRKGM